MKLVIMSFVGIGLFLTVGMFFLAPIGFYNGFPDLTRFFPVSLIIGIGLLLATIWYYFIEKRNNADVASSVSNISVIILIFLGFSSLVMSYDNAAYGLWIPLSPEELLEQSKTIFVGTITAVTPVDVEYQSQIAKNGTIKENVGPEVMTLEEYAVDIEEFLQNPQESDTITLRQATVGGVPGGPARISGFEVGDRVLFYLPKDEKQTHFPMQYLSESFKIPTFCKGQDVLTQTRPEFGADFFTMQNGVKVDFGNFTANKPVRFVYDKDMDTLSGKNFDVVVEISRNVDKNAEVVFSQEIHAKSKPCEWIAHAEWEITPKEGDYNMDINIKENGTVTNQSHTGFYVKSDVVIHKSMSPLKQFKSGIPAKYVDCKGHPVLIKASNGAPACIDWEKGKKLLERGWAKSAWMISSTVCDSDCREKLESQGYRCYEAVKNSNFCTNKISQRITDVVIPYSASSPDGKNYIPASIKVSIGINNTVVWTNVDETPHTIVGDKEEFRSPMLMPNQTWQFTFDNVGEYGYHGEPGPWLRGKITVVPMDMEYYKGVPLENWGGEPFVGRYLLRETDRLGYIDKVSIMNHDSVTVFLTYPNGTEKLQIGLSDGFIGSCYEMDPFYNVKTYVLEKIYWEQKIAQFREELEKSSKNCNELSE